MPKTEYLYINNTDRRSTDLTDPSNPRVGWWALPASHIGSAQEGGVILTKGRIHLSCVTA